MIATAPDGGGKPAEDPAEPWRPPVLDDALLTVYLRRLRLDPAAERGQQPSPEQLRRLHVAHVERVPYETVWIALGERRGIDPAESARAVAAGRGGYCYQLNGAFSALLTSLGYDVSWHRGGVQVRAMADPPGDTGNHLALTCRLDGADWWLDVGLGDGPLEPMPLAVGAAAGFRLRRSDVLGDGWRFDHEPYGGFRGMDFTPRAIAPAELEERHVELSTSPESGFVRLMTVQQRTRAGVRALRGCVLSERIGDRPATVRDVTTYDEWVSLLRDEFDLVLDVPAARLRAVWDRVLAEYAEWVRAGRP